MRGKTFKLSKNVKKEKQAVEKILLIRQNVQSERTQRLRFLLCPRYSE